MKCSQDSIPAPEPEFTQLLLSCITLFALCLSSPALTHALTSSPRSPARPSTPFLSRCHSQHPQSLTTWMLDAVNPILSSDQNKTHFMSIRSRDQDVEQTRTASVRQRTSFLAFLVLLLSFLSSLPQQRLQTVRKT